MGLFDWLRSTTPPVTTAPERPIAAATVAAVIDWSDELGRRFSVPRAEWLEKVLTPGLAKSAGEPVALASWIALGLRHGFAPELIAAARALAAADPQPERGRALLGEVLRVAGQLDEADALLATVAEDRTAPPRLVADAWCRRALIALARGDGTASERALEAALARDPDHPVAFFEAMARARAIGGEAGAKALAQQLAATTPSFRAPLFLGDLANGAERCGDAGDGLFQIAKTLLDAGDAARAIELVAPRYDAERHGAPAGVVLAQCRLAQAQWREGNELLHAVGLLPIGPLRARELDDALLTLTLAFDRLEVAAQPKPDRAPELKLRAIDRPLCLSGLRGADWLLPPKRADALELFIVPPQVVDAGAAEAELSGLSRAVALYLAESATLGTGARAIVLMPATTHGQYAVMKSRGDELRLSRLIEPGRRALLVTGALARRDGADSLELDLFDVAAQSKVTTLATSANPGDADSLLRESELLLRRTLEPARRHEASFPAGFAAAYASGLVQTLALVMAEPASGIPFFVMGERNSLRWLLALATDPRANERARLLWLSALALSAARPGRIAAEFRGEFAAAFRTAAKDSLFARAAVAPLLALGARDLWRARRDEITANSPPVWREWLRRIEGAAS